MPETPPDPRSSDEPCPLPPPFPVVGIGGSAGALEPLKAFLEGLPPRPGAAFVVVQHLPPDHPSLLGEILARHAAVPTVEVAEAMEMEPDRIYLAPPDHDLAIRSGRLVPERRDPHAPHRPLDRFLTTLAHACGERAVAVILSGTGTDGTSGAREVRIAGGVVLVQDPGSAVRGSMPRSVVTARAADYVLSPENAHRVLLRYIDSLRHEIESPERVDRRLEPYMESLLAALHARVGHDFREYKRPTLERRVLRRMSLAGIESPAHYVRFVGRDPIEAEALRRDLLIGVSTLFRDPEAWEVLAREALPSLIRSEDVPLRAWVAGCSTGEEAYSLAVLLAETLEAAGRPALDFQIYATDVDPEALERARTGYFPREVEDVLSPERLARFFLSERDGYRASDELRATLTFARHDLLSDPPILGLHLISCRNLLIYLEPEVQERVAARFHAGLVRGGVLYLGKAEGPRDGSELFEAVSKRWRIYRRGPDRAEGQDVRHLEEELRRTEEELQSTIEELETSKAELEALNEELAAANAELQETNVAVRRSEEMIRRVTDALPVLISYVDAGGRFRMVNATYEEWFARPRSEIEGRTVEEVLGEQAWAIVGPGFERALAGEAHEVEEEITLGIMGRRYLSVVRVPDRDETGKVRGVFILATDLTEREAARRELARLAAIVESSKDAILSKDLDSVITTWNRGAEKIFGWTEEEAVGQPITLIVPEDRRHEPEEIIERIRRGDQVRQLETVRLRKDGSLVNISVTVSPIVDDDGRVIGASTIDRDITFRKRAEAALRESEERYREKARALAQADRRKDEFLAMLGHELRNPLAPIRNAVEMLREHRAELAQETAVRAVEIISRQLDQLTRLVDDLLDVARITRGQIRLECRPVRLAAVIERALETARPLFEARGHHLRLALPEEEVWVDADPDRLAQAAGNLLHNAAKFTPEGGEVSVEVERDGDRSVIRVRDSGPGIPDELLPQLFELFTQGAQSLDRSQGGLGLGLALVRRLVEMQGGTVAARNLPGGGAELALELPVRAAPERPAAPAAPAPGPARQQRILVVDDNLDSADALSALLGLRGHTVVTVASGPSALEAAEELRPEAAILDIGLPEMDGFEVARRLRERFGPDLVLVALTGYGRDQDRARGLEAGFDHYLLKPVSSESLERLLSGEDLGSEEPDEAAAE